SGGADPYHALDLVQPVQVYAAIAIVDPEQAIGAFVAIRIEELLDGRPFRQRAPEDAAVAHVQLDRQFPVQFQLQGLEALDGLRVSVHARCDGNAVHGRPPQGSTHANRSGVTVGSRGCLHVAWTAQAAVWNAVPAGARIHDRS